MVDKRLDQTGLTFLRETMGIGYPVGHIKIEFFLP